MSSEWAKIYLSKGLTVLPLAPRGKNALVKDWPNRSREELINFFAKYNDNCNIAIRLDGLSVLDIERPELWGLFFEAPPEKIAEKTWVCRTGGGGYHVYFLGEIRPLRAEGFAELRSGLGQYVVAPPSIHPNGRPYKWLSNIEAVDIISPKPGLEGMVRDEIDTLRRLGALINELVAAWRPEHRHNLALWLAGYLRKARVSKEDAETVIGAVAMLAGDPEVEDRFRALKDSYDKPLEKIKGLSGLAEELKAIVGEEKAASILSLLPRPSPHEEDKPIIYYVPAMIHENYIVEEIIDEDSRPKFAIYDISSGSIRIAEEFRVGEIVYRPIDDALLRSGCVLLPGPPLEYRSEEDLFREIVDFRRRHHRARQEWEYFFDALYVMFTYIYGAFPFCPYRKMTGPKGMGKSHWLKTVGFICYRPVIASGADSEASLRRIIDKWKGTLLIDEGDLSDSSLYSTIVKVLKVGVDKYNAYIHVCDKDNPNKIESIYVYGPKLLTSHEPLRDDALESRFITTAPVAAPTRFLDEAFHEEAKRLRSKLLMYRFRNLAKAREAARQLGKPEIKREVFEDEAENIDSRVAQLLIPLYLVANDEVRHIIRRLAQVLSRMNKTEDEVLLTEALEAVRERKVNPLDTHSEGFDTYVVYYLDDIAEAIHPGLLPDEKKGFNRRLANILRAAGCIVEPRKAHRRVVYIPASLSGREELLRI